MSEFDDAADDATMEVPAPPDADAKTDGFFDEPSDAVEAAPTVADDEPAPKGGGNPRVIIIAGVVALLIAGIAGAMLLVPGLRGPGGAVASDPTQTKARVEAAAKAMEALRIYDLNMLKPLLTDQAQNAITAQQWTTAIADSAPPTATFDPIVWTGDTTASVAYDIEGSTGTMFFAPNPAKANVVTMTEASADGDLIYDVEMVAAGSGWRVVSITPKAEAFLLDTEFVKSLAATSAP